MSLAIAGTYATGLKNESTGKYTILGPFIVIGNDSTVTVNGVAIQQPVFGTGVSWSAKNGNPSSANISFYTTSTSTSYVCYGPYVEGPGPLPTSNNLAGSAAPPPQSLSTWNATYNTFIPNGKSWDKDSTLVVNDPDVTYNGTQLLKIVYTGMKGTPPAPDVDQLVWFAASGNAQNAIIYFSTDSKGNKQFGGMKWASGAEPTAANFSGSTAPLPPAPPQPGGGGHVPMVATVTEVQVSEVQVSEVQVSEVQVSEVQVSEVQVSEVQVSEVQVSEVQVSEVQFSALDEVEEAPRKDDSSGDPKEDSKASSDLSSKANEISGKKKPE